MYIADGGEADTEGDAYSASEIASDSAKVRGARVEAVSALTVESFVSVDERWRRSGAGGDGLGNTEGGERGSDRCVSRESTDGVRSRGGLRAASKTTGRGPSRARSASSPSLMLAGGDGGGGPTGSKGCCGCMATSPETTCMTVVLWKSELAESEFESRPRASICTCLGVVAAESGVGVEGDALAVKNEVPVVDATLSLCDSVTIGAGPIAEKRTGWRDDRAVHCTFPSGCAI
jgi:hypothetical protein